MQAYTEHQDWDTQLPHKKVSSFNITAVSRRICPTMPVRTFTSVPKGAKPQHQSGMKHVCESRKPPSNSIVQSRTIVILSGLCHTSRNEGQQSTYLPVKGLKQVSTECPTHKGIVGQQMNMYIRSQEISCIT